MKRGALPPSSESEHQQLLSIFDSIDEAIYVSDPDTYEVLYANMALKKEFGQVIGLKCHEAFQSSPSPCPFCTNRHIFGQNQGKTYIWEFRNSRNGRWYRCMDRAITWPDGRVVRYEMAIDITDRKEMEEALRKRNDELKLKTRKLEELNAALRVLLDQREKDKKELQERIQSNLRNLVLPYLEKLKSGRMENKARTYLEIAELNLTQIVSPFSQRLSSLYPTLTPQETRVAGLVKDGKTSKEIAHVLNISKRTVDFHRASLRKKLGIIRHRRSLRLHLMSMTFQR
ncbi:MAG: PAS domain S-box protein [Deltaproteobacteria bacterium]|nr:PAS domain S-box protein [Deltaproteobacteria bacterium]